MPNRISWDGTGFAIDGQKFFPYSGEMHHFRVHPDLWKDRLLKMKRAFCNCTGAYFYWGAIEPAPGEFNFEGICDLRRYFDTIAEVGMLAIPRPGGYICAEVDSGGHPNWLYPRVTQMRDLDPEYISASERYYAAVNDILRDFDIETGARGKIIFLYQLENEYFWGNIPYHQKLREILVNQYGESAPFIVNVNRFARGSDPAIFDTIDHYPDKWIMQPTKPMVREMLAQQPT
ncbi:MAG TPA: beta-galactosidase, partial [Candidatus Lokiarchaeia archaeon]|nr:beta-galactosidase [Candidatus Lokiarchaeia archaeon]